jgi:hypothetical protein
MLSGMHRRLLQLLIVGVVALTAAGSVGASASTKTVSVHVQRKPSIAGSVHVSLHARRLPEGGY